MSKIILAMTPTFGGDAHGAIYSISENLRLGILRYK
jgi:hypothetical protein